jgi:hypothetical protein
MPHCIAIQVFHSVSLPVTTTDSQDQNGTAKRKEDKWVV